LWPQPEAARVRTEAKMKNVSLRQLLALLLTISALTITSASAVDRANPDAAAGSVAATGRSPSSELGGGWHFVRTHNPQGGADAISIAHTADTSKSDLDLAGLMIRCSGGSGEAVIVLIRPFSLRALPHVALGKPEAETQFNAKVVPPGTLVLLPPSAASLVNGPWHDLSELSVRINEGQATIRGVIPLAGLQAAFKILMTNCAAQ